MPWKAQLSQGLNRHGWTEQSRIKSLVILEVSVLWLKCRSSRLSNKGSLIRPQERLDNNEGIVQTVEHKTFNLGVGGSNPSILTTLFGLPPPVGLRFHGYRNPFFHSWLCEPPATGRPGRFLCKMTNSALFSSQTLCKMTKDFFLKPLDFRPCL